MTRFILTKTQLQAKTITVLFEFCSKIDSELLSLIGAKQQWTLSITRGALLLVGENRDNPFSLDMEDTFSLKDNRWHSLAITATPAGSKIFLDGYQCFSTTADLAPQAIAGAKYYALAEAPGLSIRNFEIFDRILDEKELLSLALAPQPLIEFAAKSLSDYDTETVSSLDSGSIYARYRVRGPGQIGTIFSAGRVGKNGQAGEETLALLIDEKGLLYRVRGRNHSWREFRAYGDWGQGNWHDVVVRTAHGAVDIYVDGFMEAHYPGQTFFKDAGEIDIVTIGQDIHGARLFGEVRNAAIYESALHDEQIKQLARVEPVRTDCLFDVGYQGSISYRIPSLLTTQSGTIIAGADQRETIANDAPNSINFVIRRSTDGGKSWGDLQTLITYPGHGATGASVIDSCVVQDQNTGRIFVLIDHFPGGIGQPNAEQGVGIDQQGRFRLYDSEGAEYSWLPDGRVLDNAGKETNYQVDELGNVSIIKAQANAGGKTTKSSKNNTLPGGNVFLHRGEDPNETLLTMRTSYLQMIYSDDDGLTWSKPVNLDHQVKEEWMRFLGTSPGSGIQLRYGKHKGRLIIPVYYNTDNWKAFSCAVVYSDDGGETWRRGASPNDGREVAGEITNSRELKDEIAATHESTVIERSDGSLVMYMRNQHPKAKVARSISYDGGETWNGVEFDETLDEIFSLPNAVNVSTSESPDRIVFANASQMMPYRGRGVLRVSHDGGRTWTKSRTFNPAHYVYQCMSFLPDGNLGLLWERETQGLYLSQIPFSWFK